MIKILEKEKLIKKLIYLGAKYQDYFFMVTVQGKWTISETKDTKTYFSCSVSDFYSAEILEGIFKGRDDNEFLENCKQAVEKKIKDIEKKLQRKMINIRILGLGIVFFIAVMWLLSKLPETEEQKVERLEIVEQERIREENCRNFITCWARKNDFNAEKHSQKIIERRANYDFRWVDSWTRPKFSRYKWLNIKEGTITYIGDAIQFQNGFGAWQNYIYEVDYDPSFTEVIDVRVKPGRL
jgi:hypothetical protein